MFTFSELYAGPGTIAPHLYAYLKGKSLDLTDTNLLSLLVGFSVIFILLVTTLVMKITRGQEDSPAARFDNPLRNINVCLAFVVLFRILLQLFPTLLTDLPSLRGGGG